MSEKKHINSSQQYWVGIAIIVIGVLFLMQSLHIMNFGHMISSWWPIIIVLIGFSKLQGPDKRNGSILFIVGIVLLSGTLDFINWGSIFRFWPLILIFLGVSMLMKSKGKPGLSLSRSQETSDDYINASAIFGGTERIIHSKAFKGGDVMVLFGGVDLDLRSVVPAESGCTLNVTALFGGAEIIVPENWKIKVTGTPIFGGIDDKSRGADKDSPIVTVNCTAAFGGIEIKT